MVDPMTTGRLLPVILIGLIATWSGASAASAHLAPQVPLTIPSSSGSPSSLTPGKLNVRSPKPSDWPPITFFVASGPVNACGPDCNGWIAAEGKIDLNAAQRLRTVLAKLGPRKLPLYLNSAGGSVLGAIELGRLVRSHNLTVSVARTLPAACQHDELQNEACESLKRSRQDLASELDWIGAMCNSACVLVLAGGARRSVPPGVRLGVHAIGVDADKTSLRGPRLAAATRSANAHIVEFLHDMGIPRALFDISNATPHDSSRFLGRDELVRLRLDTREFGEADWRFADKPIVRMAKGFFMHTGDTGIAYPEALLRLNCGAGKSMRLTFAWERAATPEADARPVRLTLNGMRIDVPYASQVGQIEMHTTTLRPDVMASASDNATIEISGLDLSEGRAPDNKAQDNKAHDSEVHDSKAHDGKAQDHVILNMTGFSSAYARLRKVCAETASALTTAQYFIDKH
jgi:hypothetical protein